MIGAEDRIFTNIKVTPDSKNVLMFIENLKLKLGLNDIHDIECEYEAGCPGYSLYNQVYCCRRQMCHIDTDNNVCPAGTTDQDRCQGCHYDRPATDAMDIMQFTFIQRKMILLKSICV